MSFQTVSFLGTPHFIPSCISESAATKIRDTLEQGYALLNEAKCLFIIPNQEYVEEKIVKKKALLEEVHQMTGKMLALFPKDRELLFLECAVLTSYGTLFFEEQPDICRRMTQTAFDLQSMMLSHELETQNQLEVTLHPLKMLEDHFSTEKTEIPFSFLEDPLFYSLLSGMLEVQNMAHAKEVFILAEILSWHGFSALALLNSSPEKEQLERISFLFLTAENLYRPHLDYPSCSFGYAELCYRGLSFISLKSDPRNLENAHRYLDMAAEFNSSFEMQARVIYQKACNYKEAGDLLSFRQLIKEAFQIYSKISNEEQDPCFLANLQHDYGTVLYHDIGGASHQAENHVQLALNYAEKKRGARDNNDCLIHQNNDKTCFGLYDLSMARIKIHQYDYETALKHLNRALETLEKSVDRTEECAMANLLKETIQSMKG